MGRRASCKDRVMGDIYRNMPNSMKLLLGRESALLPTRPRGVPAGGGGVPGSESALLHAPPW